MIVGMWGIKIRASVTVSTINRKLKYIRLIFEGGLFFFYFFFSGLGFESRTLHILIMHCSYQLSQAHDHTF